MDNRLLQNITPIFLSHIKNQEFILLSTVGFFGNVIHRLVEKQKWEQLYFMGQKRECTGYYAKRVHPRPETKLTRLDFRQRRM